MMPCFLATRSEPKISPCTHVQIVGRGQRPTVIGSRVVKIHISFSSVWGVHAKMFESFTATVSFSARFSKKHVAQDLHLVSQHTGFGYRLYQQALGITD